MLLVLADHPGRRQVVRAGDTVVKAFAPSERPAWRREVAALRALTGTALAPALVGTGPLWTATMWVDGVDATGLAGDILAVHRCLGAWLARIHLVKPAGMLDLSVVDRLREHLADPPTPCPDALARALRTTIEPWVPLVCGGRRVFVHGDWGTSNVLFAAAASPRVAAVIDFEDAHVGDPAEDFRWQVLAGPDSTEYTAMSSAYTLAGGTLGPNAAERLALAGVELCLDALRWEMPREQRVLLRERCLHTLDDVVSGRLPEPPPAT
ncbi:MAG TPA: phosphotransferase [Acidimicrobiales bacterium]|nr:phosphotransferase [Acidimicrobiales bacterium]